MVVGLSGFFVHTVIEHKDTRPIVLKTEVACSLLVVSLGIRIFFWKSSDTLTDIVLVTVLYTDVVMLSLSLLLNEPLGVVELMKHTWKGTYRNSWSFTAAPRSESGEAFELQVV